MLGRIAVLVAVLVVVLSHVVLADSGWPACILNGPDYDQAQCIGKIQRSTGAEDPPSRHPVTEEQAIAVYGWAVEAGMSDCTAVGAGGVLLPQEYIERCIDYVPTPTATWTITPTPTVTVTPTATPPAHETPEVRLDHPWWLPLVGNCIYDLEYLACGQ